MLHLLLLASLLFLPIAGGFPVEVLQVLQSLSLCHDLLIGGDVYGGGGDDKTMLRLTVGELVRVAQPRVISLSA